MDIEGAETKGLRGAARTVSALKPDLIVEFNAIVMQRFFSVKPEDFYKLLTTLYPYIFIIRDGQTIVKVNNYATLLNSLENGAGLEDLYCTFKPQKVGQAFSFGTRCKNIVRGIWLLSLASQLSRYDKKRTDVTVISPSYEIIPSMDKIETYQNVEFPMKIKLWNKSKYSYSSNYIHPINVSYHWLRENGEYAVFDGIRTPLPQEVHPGEKIEFEMKVIAPDFPGTYWLQVSLVQEGIVWFHQMNDRLSIQLPAQILKRKSLIC